MRYLLMRRGLIIYGTRSLTAVYLIQIWPLKLLFLQVDFIVGRRNKAKQTLVFVN